MGDYPFTTHSNLDADSVGYTQPGVMDFTYFYLALSSLVLVWVSHRLVVAVGSAVVSVASAVLVPGSL